MNRDSLSSDPEDYCIIDTETRSTVDVTEGGVHTHIAAGRVIIVTYAIGLAPVQEWVVRDFTPKERLNWQNCPDDLYAFYKRARAGEAWFGAWNSGFDRIALSRGIDIDPETLAQLGHEVIRVPMMVDVMAQGGKSHLPPDLMGASQMNGSPIKKQANGKALIRLFCDAAKSATPLTHPAEWAEFRSYARDDVAATRDIFQTTLPLDKEEWSEFWANEYINDRGLPIDVPFVANAAKLAELNADTAAAAVADISRGELYSVNQHAKMLEWVDARLCHLPDVERILTREVTIEQDAEGDDVTTVAKSLSKERVEELVLMLEKMDETIGLTDDEFEALRMLEVRQYGSSATPQKFIKMLPMVHEGRVKGQYVFNGANATGRFSSRGLQMHNLTRAILQLPGGNPKGEDRRVEVEALETISDMTDVNATYAALRETYGPVGRTLSRLIRPSILAPEGYTIFAPDWSAIEARALPWLADTPTAHAVLDVFRETDLDPSLPDIYMRQAGSILHIPALDVSKAQRQSHGKVPVLSLGFGGGEGALFNMARNYGVVFEDEEAGEIVTGWRDANPWARMFWDDVWAAALAALDRPGEVFAAGRVSYVYEQIYRGGTLFAILPCGRSLLYPKIRWVRRDVKNKKTGAVETKTQLTYMRGRGRAALWYGTLAENATQGICGSLLRWVLREFEERHPGYLIGHTHDEVIGMSHVNEVDRVAGLLGDLMSTGPTWAEGLPLAAEVDINDWYTKTEG